MAKKEPKLLTLPIHLIELPEENPRDIKPREFKKLCQDIKNVPHFLIQRPPLVNHITTDGRYICYAGNQRTKAAAECGYTELQVWVEENVPKKLQDDRMLKDNLHRGEWDLTKLLAFDTNTLLGAGFNPDVLDGMFNDMLSIADDDFNEEEAVKEVQDRGVRTQPDDIYQLGPHRLLCGDSTKPEDVQRLFGDARAKIIYTDPPYNIGYDYTKGASETKNHYTDKPVHDSKSHDDYREFLLKVMTNALAVCEKDIHVFMWCDQAYTGLVQEIYRQLGITNRRICIWVKNFANPVPQMAFNKVLEFCPYGTVGKPQFNKDQKNMHEILNRDFGSSNIYDDFMSIVQAWCVKKEHTNDYQHPTQKPISLHEKPLKRCSSVGDIVADFFGGSGSTLISCEDLQRTAYLIEQQPVFCDVIVDRWEKKTGQKAELIRNANATT